MESAKPARPVGGACAVPAALYTELVAALGDAQETAAMLQGGVAISGEEVAILLRDIRWVAEANYQARDAFGMEIGSAGFVPGFSKAARDGTVPVFFHTHPGAGPRPSTRDEKVESEMRRLALIRTGRPYFAALILGGTRDSPEFTARIYVHPDRSPINVRKLRVVGDHILLLAAADAGVEVDAEIYDRQVRAFGQAGQAVLNSMTVGVVGAGGTGSSTFEQLVRLGIGTIVLIDDDLIKKANVTRGHETGIGDAGKHKVEVLEKAGARIGLGTSVLPVIGRVTAREVAQRLRHCDVVFGCTDDHWGRAVLSRLSVYYLVPVIDMGVVIDSGPQGLVKEIIGRVTYVAPTTACLRCRGQADPDLVRLEQLPPDERSRLANQGYAPALGEPDPAVVSYTTMTAALAIGEFLDRVFHWAEGRVPSELRLRVLARKISRTTQHPDSGCYCEDPYHWGLGDQPDFLGLMWAG